MTNSQSPFAESLSDDDWEQIQKSIERFEIQLGGDSTADWQTFLPKFSDPLFLMSAVELIKVDQEYRWRRNERPLIESYLSKFPQLTASDALRELLRGECQTRWLVGDTPKPEDLERRFPGLVGKVDFEEMVRVAEVESGRTEEIDESMSTRRTSIEETIDVGAGGARVLGRYRLTQRIGRGAMGVVFQSYDSILKRNIALKIPTVGRTPTSASTSWLIHRASEPGSEQAASASRFLDEARALASVQHPNICTIHDYGTIDRVPFLAMELLAGPRLDAWIAEHHPIDQWVAAEIVLKLARALQAIHDAGLVHRDVKSANIVLADNGDGDGVLKPVLTDFGIARYTASRTEGPAGTPAFMSPEQAAGKPVDSRSDVYSLGVVFYHLLAGRLPFEGTVDDVLLAVQTECPRPSNELRPEIETQLAAICQRAIEKSPDHRFATAAEFANDLQSTINNHSRRSGRRFIISTIVGILLIAAGLWGGRLLWSHRNEGFSSTESTSRGIPDENQAAVIHDQTLQFAEKEIARGLPKDPRDLRNVILRRELILLLRGRPGSRESLKSAQNLSVVPWPAVDFPEREAIWWDRRSRIRYGMDRDIIDFSETSIRKSLVIRGRINKERLQDYVVVRMRSGQAYVMQLFSLTSGFRPHAGFRWMSDTAERAGSWDVPSGGTGVGVQLLVPRFSESNRRIDFFIDAAKLSQQKAGDYLLVVSQVSDEDEAKENPNWAHRLVEIQKRFDNQTTKPTDAEVSAYRSELLVILKESQRSPEGTAAARLLSMLPGVTNDTQAFVDFQEIPEGKNTKVLSMPDHGELVITGEIPANRDAIEFGVTVKGSAPVVTQLYSLTNGFCPSIIEQWPIARPPYGDSDSNTVTPTSPARIVTAPLPLRANNRIKITVAPEPSFAKSGRFLLYIRQQDSRRR